MPVIVPNARLAYFPVPKVACTSIKKMLHEVVHGAPFAPFEGKRGRTVFVHALYPAVPFADLDVALLADLHRIAVVRDPVRRVLSAYGNRVVFHRDLHAAKVAPRLAEAGLSPDPDLDSFVDRLDSYCALAPKIAHHLRPQVEFLGSDPGYFGRLYRFSELEQLAEDIRQRTGTSVPLPWQQRGGPKFALTDLSPARQEALRARFAADYQSFGAWFE